MRKGEETMIPYTVQTDNVTEWRKGYEKGRADERAKLREKAETVIQAKLDRVGICADTIAITGSIVSDIFDKEG
jgi:hypothetical protein